MTENKANYTDPTTGKHYKADTSSPSSPAANGGHVLTAAFNRQNCLFLKDCHMRASFLSGLGLPCAPPA